MTLPPGSQPKDTCPYDGCPNEICGGPHVVIKTDLGDEVVKYGEKPVGTPLTEMSEAERQAHMEAEANAQRDSDG